MPILGKCKINFSGISVSNIWHPPPSYPIDYAKMYIYLVLSQKVGTVRKCQGRNGFWWACIFELCCYVTYSACAVCITLSSLFNQNESASLLYMDSITQDAFTFWLYTNAQAPWHLETPGVWTKIVTRSPRLGRPGLGSTTQSVLVVLAGPPTPPPPLPTQTPLCQGLWVLIWSTYHPPSSPTEDYTPVWHAWAARDGGRAARMAARSAPLSQTTLMSAGCEWERA